METITKQYEASKLFTIIRKVINLNLKTFLFVVFDSWGKIPAGLFYQNRYDFGHYEQCITSSFNNTKVHYCLLHGSLVVHNKNETYSFGICVPESCDKKSLAVMMTNYLQNLNMTMRLDPTCLPLEQPPFDRLQWTAVTLFTLFVVLSLMNDFLQLVLGKKMPPPLSVFSVIQNAKSLFRTRARSGDSLECINGIRSISMVWIVIHHGVTYWWHTVANANVSDFHNFEKSAADRVVEGARMTVDTFFVMGGLLTCLSFFRDQDKG